MVIWRPDFSWPGWFFSISPAIVAMLEGAAEHGTLRHPLLQVLAEDVLLEKGLHIRRFEGAPGGEDVVRGEVAKRAVAGTLHALGDQHAEGLVREPPLEAVGHQEPPPAAREGLDEQPVLLRQCRA